VGLRPAVALRALAGGSGPLWASGLGWGTLALALVAVGGWATITALEICAARPARRPRCECFV
jgi:hypothetical protein